MSRKTWPVRCGATDRAASRLAAAVTADTTTSLERTASAAETARRTPILAPACRSLSPSGAGNRMSQADMLAVPASRRPEAMAWPASPKPMKQMRTAFVCVMSDPQLSFF
jgi:hypothetical protein